MSTNNESILKNHEGLNFKLAGSSNKRDILFRTLENRGINNIAKFANPVPGVDFKESQSKKQPLASHLAKLFNKVIKSKQRISILVDNDADGFTSAAFMYKYLTNFDILPHFIFTEGKNHGIKSMAVKSKIAKIKTGFLIIPDASLNLQDIKFLHQWNIPYLIIDHHDLNYQKFDLENKYHIFNNQWNKTYINREFTGVGVVFQFCKLLDQLNNTNYANNYLYLLSIGQVGDVSDVSKPEIRYYVQLGYKQMTNSHLFQLTTNIGHLSSHELSFSIIPKINAVCRTGSLEEKNSLLNAMVDYKSNELVKISFHRKSQIDHKFHKHFKDVDLYYLEAKALERIKAKQKRAVKESLKSLTNIYETKPFIVALDKTGSFRKEEAGLIANQLASKYQKPALVLRSSNDPKVYKGSARGNTKVMKDFRKFCNQTCKFKYALGHGNAFGVMINDCNLEDLLHEYKNVNLNNSIITYTVDNLYKNDVPTKSDIKAFDDHRNLFGGRVKDPQLGFHQLYVKSSDIKFYGSVLTMKSHGLKFIQFNYPKDLHDKITNYSDYFYFDIVGTPDINRFMKFHYPQIIIKTIKLITPVPKQVSNDHKNFQDFYF